MRVLFIAPRFPFPPLQGDRLRGYELLRVLSRRHAITLLAPPPDHDTPQARAALAACCERWVPAPRRPLATAAQLASAGRSPLPLQTLLFATPALSRLAAQLAHDEPFGLVHAHTARVAPAALAAGPGPRLIDFIDALSLNMYRRARRQRGPLAWLLDLEARRMARYERQLARSFERQIITSPLDRAVIGTSERLRVIPNGAPVEQFPYAEDGRDPATLVFSGRMAYFPNADAAVFLAAEVFPLVRRAVPGAQLRIVGAEPPRRVRALARLPGVAVTGFVPRMQDELARATLAVCPLRGGSGFPNKAAEAMASGAPLVTTPATLDAIDARDGEHLLVGRSAAELAEQTVRLLRDQALRRRLARSARLLMEERYTWDAAASALDALYHEAAGARLAPQGGR